MELSVPLLCLIEWKNSSQKFANSVGLPFRDLLPESTIIEALEAEKLEYRNRLFNKEVLGGKIPPQTLRPVVTIWAFLSQVLDPDKSLQNAVSRVIAWLADEAGELIPSTDTGGYSKARKRLPESLRREFVWSNRSRNRRPSRATRPLVWTAGENM